MDDDDSFVPEERNEAGLKLDKRMVRCLSRKALIRRLAVFLEASISFLSFLFFFFFSSSFSSPVLLPVNLIKNLAIARAKKGSGAYHHREKLPSFAPPSSCDIIPPVFYLADTSPFCDSPDFSRHFYAQRHRTNAISSLKELFLPFFEGNIFFFIVLWEISSIVSSNGRVQFFCENFHERLWIVNAYFLFEYFVDISYCCWGGGGRGEICFLWNTGKTKYLFICLFVYLFIFNFVCFLLKHRIRN